MFTTLLIIYAANPANNGSNLLGKLKKGAKVVGTGLGAVGSGYAFVSSKQAEEAQAELNSKLQQTNETVKDLSVKMDDQAKKLDDQSKLLNSISSKIDELSKTKLLNLDFKLDYLWNIPSYWDRVTIVLCFNILSSFNLLSLALSFLLGRYGNIIIDKYNLQSKYPRLEKYFRYRLSLQKYYFTYLTVSAILIVLITFLLIFYFY
uniref:hypothetical protein n=1 Tax=Daedaleopsis nitida TaxID=1140402 RepID=UPI0030E483E4